MEIGRYDISDILSGLPDSHALGTELPDCDIFVATLGFEDRAATLATKFSRAGSLDKANVVLVEYPTNTSDNETNLVHFQDAAEKADGFHRLRYSRGSYLSDLTDTLKGINGGAGARVLFDISTCSSYVFYPTMKALMDLDVHLTLVYSEATKYYPLREEWEEVAQKANQETSLFIEAFEKAEFQSIGVEDVYASPLFSEMNPGNRPTTFVGIPNFSAARMNALVTRDQEINKTSARDIYWFIGEPSSAENQWRAEAVRRTNSLAVMDHAKIRFVSTLHYKEMIKALEEIWFETRHSFHMSIGTLGSKMQHVGTYLFLCLHKDVGLLLTEPKSFRGTTYSTGEGPGWQICLGETKKLKEALQQYLTFRWRL